MECSVGECGVKRECLYRCRNNHYIHKLCLRRWKRMCRTNDVNTTCPICRTEKFILCNSGREIIDIESETEKETECEKCRDTVHCSIKITVAIIMFSVVAAALVAFWGGMIYTAVTS